MTQFKENIRNLTDVEHVLKRPGMHLGSLKCNPKQRYVYHFKTDKVENEEIMLADGLERMYIEGLSNAVDHQNRTRQTGKKAGYIKITASPTSITIHNTGMPFTIRKFESHDVYRQEAAFAWLRTGSNYDDDKDSKGIGGKNGYGIKLANIYSKQFELTVIDRPSKLKYYQKWQNNLDLRHEPKITSSKAPSSTTIKYQADFERFDSKYAQGFTDDIIGVFAFHAASVSATAGLRVVFNYHKSKEERYHLDFNRLSMADYTKMMLGVDLTTTNYISYVEWNDAKGKLHHLTKLNAPVEAPLKYRGMENTKLCLIDTPDNGQSIGFVNNIITYRGGVHLEKVYQEVRQRVIPVLNETTSTKAKLTIRDLRPHLSMVMMCNIEDAQLESQMKVYLNSPTPELYINDKFKAVLKWKLADRLQNELDAKKMKILTDIPNKTDRYSVIKGHVPAFKAGTKESHKCNLDICEGQSAQNYSITRSICLNDGKTRHPYYGSLAFKGKPVNVVKCMKTEAGMIKFYNNTEYKSLIGAMGFKPNVDYTIEANYRNLKYGQITILADSDDDGKHIQILIYAMIRFIAPSFLQRNPKCIKMLRTPLVRVTKGKKFHNFLVQAEFDAWWESLKVKSGWDVKYCKGLGSSNKKEIQRDCDNIHLVDIIEDELAEKFINTAIGCDSKLRKEWMTNNNSLEGIEKLKKLKISTFVDCELVVHAWSNLRRTVPGLDGFKPSQRKVMYAALTKWGKKTRVKTNTLATLTSELTHYHHGPASLIKTIEMMPLSFAGSNNLPYFVPDGQMGTRRGGGQDAAAARYTELMVENWWDIVFRKDDRLLWSYVEEDGEVAEPANLLPIVPLFMINGARGVGSGWRSLVPNYHPVKVAESLIKMIDDEEPDIIEPWYRSYTGKLRVKARIRTKIDGKNEDITKNITEPDIGDFELKESGRGLFTEGVYTCYKVQTKSKKPKYQTIITELPIDLGVNQYINKVLSKLKEDGEILGWIDTSQNQVHITVDSYKPMNMSKLGLRRVLTMKNMYIMDQNGFPRHFKTAIDAIKYWFDWRKQFYAKRVEKLIEKYQEKTKDLRDKHKFVRAVVRGFEEGKKPGQTIVLLKQTHDVIEKQLEAFDLKYDILKKVNTAYFTKKGLAKIEDQMKATETQLNHYKQIEPLTLWRDELEEFVAYIKARYKS